VEPGKYFPLLALDHHMEHNHIRLVCYYQGLGEFVRNADPFPHGGWKVDKR